jgi:single-strand DNA-binding protein
MARDLNKVTIIGRLGDAPTLRFTQSGKAVANFSLATNWTYKDSEGTQHDDVQWHRCVAWGAAGELLSKHCKKGERLYVEGRIDYRKWTDKENVERLSCDIIVDEFVFLSVRPAVANGRREPVDDPMAV